MIDLRLRDEVESMHTVVLGASGHRTITASGRAVRLIDIVPRLWDDTRAEGQGLWGAQLAGLSENAVGPQLARTPSFSACASPEGRVTRASVERARYDAELGRPAPTNGQPAEPLMFRRRRDT